MVSSMALGDGSCLSKNVVITSWLAQTTVYCSLYLVV